VRRAALALVLVAALPAALAAQADQRPSTVTAFASLGFVHNVSSFDVAPTGLERNGLAGGLRVMWQPGHLLSAGVEVGHTHVYSVKRPVAGGSEELDQTLDAWPILVVFSMAPAQRLHINVGTGPAINTSSTTLQGTTASSSALGSSFMASAIYLVPVSSALALGGELRYLRLAKYEDNNLSLQITLAWLMSRH
jgi:hypothetical protein